MQVPLFDMAAELAPLRSEIDAAIARVLDSGQFIGGPEVEGFERALAASLGCAHAVGVSSGTDALLAIYMGLGIGPGDEIVTTPLTFFATAGSAARLGAKVVFADIDEDTLCLDPAAALDACTSKTKVIVPVNLFGYPAELPLTALPIVEDAAHAPAAPRGIAAALSFFPTKNLGALGDAGAVLTDSPTLADRVRLLRTHGARPKYHHVAIGGNLRLDALQAAVLGVKLAHLEAANARRRATADRYRTALVDLPLRLQADHPGHAYHQFSIRTDERDRLRAFLADAGIGTEIYYPEPLHVQPVFPTRAALPVAERACKELLALPIHPTLTVAAQDHVVDQITAFYRR